ncbi:MAG: M67 family metallopeptidase [Anaerolineales bacterium]
MTLILNKKLLDRIEKHAEKAYPDEGAGLLIGQVKGETRRVQAVLELTNNSQGESRHNRYLISPQDLLKGEKEASARNMDVLGVFHSHPDHPNQPSEFDRKWALPWFSYMITSVNEGIAAGNRSWRLSEDRSQFFEEEMHITDVE